MNNTEQGRLNLYKVDKKYIRDLHRADDRVSSVSPQIGKDKRVYIGLLIIGKKYKQQSNNKTDKNI